MRVGVIVTGQKECDLDCYLRKYFSDTFDVCIGSLQEEKGFYRLLEDMVGPYGETIEVEYLWRIMGGKIFMRGFRSDFLNYLGRDKNKGGNEIPYAFYENVEVTDIRRSPEKLEQEFSDAEVNCF